MARFIRLPVAFLAGSLVVGAVAWRVPPLRGAVAEARAPRARASAAAPSSAKRGGDRPVAVQIATARAGDLRVVRSGLGTVTSRHSVQVRARVSGQLIRVHFREGDLVEKGQLLAEIDPRPFEAELLQAQGQITRDRALLERSKLDLSRYEALGREQIAKQEDVEARQSLVRQYEGALQAGEGLLKQASLALSFSRLVAPISGRIGLRQIDPGNNVSPADPTPIAVINAVRPIAVVFSLPEDAVPAIAKRLEESRAAGDAPSVEAWDKGSKNLLGTGKLLTLDNQIDPGTGTIKLKAEFPNDDGALYPNQFVNVRLVIETLSGVTVVPTAAVQRGPSGPFVYVVEKEIVAVRPVTLGPTEGAEVTVERGLSPGESVVVSGADRLREGARVAVQSAARSPRP